VDKETILMEGKHSEFWKLICEAIDKRIEASRNQLETQLTIDMIKVLQHDIRQCREFKNLPNVLVTLLGKRKED
jgi:hypothetical protein